MPALHQTLPLPAALRAGFHARTLFRAGAAARIASVELCDGNFLFAAERGFFERDFKVITQIIAALRLRRVGLLAAEKIFKNVAARRAAKDIAENIKWIMEAAAAPGAMARVERRVAELVVGRALLRVAQRLVSLAKLLEFFLGGLVAGIFVRMIFDGEAAVGFFGAVGGCLAC